MLRPTIYYTQVILCDYDIAHADPARLDVYFRALGIIDQYIFICKVVVGCYTSVYMQVV